MKIDFNSDKKKVKNGKSFGHLERGSYEDILKHREKLQPQIESEIQELLKDYHGQGIAIILMKEDENADVVGVRTLITGVGTPTAQAHLAKTLHDSSKDVVDLLVKSATESGDVQAMLSVVEDLIGTMKSKVTEKED